MRRGSRLSRASRADSRGTQQAAGVTLLEVLVVAAIVVVAYLAISQTFQSASKVWESDARLSGMLARARAALDLLASEIREAPYVVTGTGCTNAGHGCISLGVKDTPVDDSGSHFRAVGWIPKTAQGPYLQTYKEASGTNPAEWRFNVMAPGNYNLWEWHPALSTNTTAATYTIYNGSATPPTASVNQTTGGGRWNLLGTFNFATPGQYAVQLTAGAGVVADALLVQLATDGANTGQGTYTVAYDWAPATPTGTLKKGYRTTSTGAMTTVFDFLENTEIHFTGENANGGNTDDPFDIRRVTLHAILTDPENKAPKLVVDTTVVRQTGDPNSALQPPIINEIHYAPKVYFYDDMDGGGVVLKDASTTPPTYQYGNFIDPDTAANNNGWLVWNDWFDNGKYGPAAPGWTGWQATQNLDGTVSNSSCASGTVNATPATAPWQLGLLTGLGGTGNFYGTQDPHQKYYWNTAVGTTANTPANFNSAAGQFLSPPPMFVRNHENPNYPFTTASFTTSSWLTFKFPPPKIIGGSVILTQSDLVLERYRTSSTGAWCLFAAWYGTCSTYPDVANGCGTTGVGGSGFAVGSYFETHQQMSDYTGNLAVDDGFVLRSWGFGELLDQVDPTLPNKAQYYWEKGNPNGGEKNNFSATFGLSNGMNAISPYGSKVWAPQVKGRYLDYTPLESRIVTPAIDLTGASATTKLQFSFWRSYEFSPTGGGAAAVGVLVEVGVPNPNGSGSLTCPAGFSYSTPWQRYCWTQLTAANSSLTPAYDATIANVFGGGGRKGGGTSTLNPLMLLSSWGTTNTNWTTVTATLSNAAWRVKGTKFRFRFGTLNTRYSPTAPNSFSGPVIDNIMVYEGSYPPSSMQFIELYNPNAFSIDVGSGPFAIRVRMHGAGQPGSASIIPLTVGGTTTIPGKGYAVITGSSGTNVYCTGATIPPCPPSWVAAPASVVKLALSKGGSPLASLPLDWLYDNLRLVSTSLNVLDRVNYNVYAQWRWPSGSGPNGWTGTAPWQLTLVDNTTNPQAPFPGSINGLAWNTAGYTPGFGSANLLSPPGLAWNTTNQGLPVLSYMTWYQVNRLWEGMEVQVSNSGGPMAPLDPGNLQKSYEAPVYPLNTTTFNQWGTTDFSSATGSQTSPGFWNRQVFNVSPNLTQFQLKFSSSAPLWGMSPGDSVGVWIDDVVLSGIWGLSGGNPKGTGASLKRVNPLGPGDVPTNFKGGVPSPGNP